MFFKVPARVAELVDASVSKTDEVTRAGSIPASGTLEPVSRMINGLFDFME